MSNDSLGDRMKGYENAYRLSLPERMPVIIRVDGKAFHTYTKDCKKPVDENLVSVMNDTAAFLCKNIQGAQIGYVQSDEISILVNNYKELETQSWFDNNLQKMASVSAAMASSIFTANSYKIFDPNKNSLEWADNVAFSPERDIRPAFFDSRVFLVPKEDVVNYFLWRQQDATRNSVQMLARSLYSHKQCENKNNSELQEMIFQKGINWNDCSVSQKRGRCIIKRSLTRMALNQATGQQEPVIRSTWEVDNNIPIFSQDRDYIGRYV